jgi:hypothetical protein
MPSIEKVTKKCEYYPIRKLKIFNVACSLLPSFIQQVPAKIRKECQGWGDGPLESHPCDCRVQALVWLIVEGKMGVRGAPKHQKKASQQSKPTLLQG